MMSAPTAPSTSCRRRLRSEDDRRALVEGVRDGTIDVIVSSHDPQDADTKRLPFAEAAFGASAWTRCCRRP